MTNTYQISCKNMSIQYYGFDLHDTILIRSTDNNNKSHYISDMLEFNLKSELDYKKHWYTIEGREKFTASFKKYSLFEGYVLNPDFKYILEKIDHKKMFIYSNCGNVLEVVQKKFPELNEILFFSAASLKCFKPNTNGFKHIIDSLNSSPEEILYCGDNILNDYISPRLLGIHSILYSQKNFDIPGTNIQQIDSLKSII